MSKWANSLLIFSISLCTFRCSHGDLSTGLSLSSDSVVQAQKSKFLNNGKHHFHRASPDASLDPESFGLIASKSAVIGYGSNIEANVAVLDTCGHHRQGHKHRADGRHGYRWRTCSRKCGLHLKPEVVTSDQVTLASSYVRIGRGASIAGILESNHTHIHHSADVGVIQELAALPGLPEFLEASPGHIDAPSNVDPLPPGRYRNLQTQEGASIRLAGGTYHLSRVKLRNGAKLLCLDDCTLLIKKSFRTGSNVEISTAPAAAGSLKIYVGGRSSHGRGFVRSVHIGKFSSILARFHLSTGRIYVGRGSSVEGSLIAPHVALGPSTRLNSPELEPPPPVPHTWSLIDHYSPAYQNISPTAITADANGNVFAAGWLSQGDDTTVFEVRHLLANDPAWQTASTFTQVGADALAPNLATGLLGDLWLSVTIQNQWTTRLSNDNGLTWVDDDVFSAPGSSATHAFDMAADKLGNVCVAGRSIEQGIPNWTVRCKTATSGNWTTVDQFQLAAGQPSEAKAIAIGANLIYVVGTATDLTGAQHWIARTSPIVNQTWSTSDDFSEAGNNAIPADVAISAGTVVATGVIVQGDGTARWLTRAHSGAAWSNADDFGLGPFNPALGPRSVGIDLFAGVWVSGLIFDGSQITAATRYRGDGDPDFADHVGHGLFVPFDYHRNDEIDRFFGVGLGIDASSGSFFWGSQEYLPDEGPN